MVRPLTPKQQRDYERLESERKHAEQGILEAEKAAGRKSPQHVVALRERDEILAKMNRINPHAMVRGR